MKQPTQIAEADILACSDGVRKIARHRARRIPCWACLNVDDLYQIGMAAVVECAPRYDGERGSEFWHFASSRAKGAMVDALRDADPLDRNHRKAVRAAGEESSYAAVPYDALFDTRICTAPSQLEVVIAEQIATRSIESLQREYEGKRALAILQCTLEGKRQPETAAALGITQGRVSQVLTAAAKHLDHMHGVRA